MEFRLPELDYDYDSLEPHIDARTMKIHHTKHHQGYTDKLNKAIEGTNLQGSAIEEILNNVSKHSLGIRNNGGGYYNHTLFWKILSPSGGGKPEAGSAIHEAILDNFDNFEDFRIQFKNSALGRFGSGWAWLCVNDETGKLNITSTPNQDNPIMDVVSTRGKPILGLDVWEHAYYLKYQNRRADYVDSFFNLINWEQVNKHYEIVRKEDEELMLV